MLIPSRLPRVRSEGAAACLSAAVLVLATISAICALQLSVDDGRIDSWSLGIAALLALPVAAAGGWMGPRLFRRVRGGPGTTARAAGLGVVHGMGAALLGWVLTAVCGIVLSALFAGAYGTGMAIYIVALGAAMVLPFGLVLFGVAGAALALAFRDS